MSVALSPIINPHQSILRRRHIIDGRCRTVPCQQRRRQSLAAMQSNNIRLPPTPCKTNYAIRKSAYNGKRIRKKSHYYRGTRSRTPSPNKKRKTVRSEIMLNKSADKKKNIEYHLQQSQYFQNLGLIGVGSFSQVFKVQNAATKKIYAIKRSNSILNTREAVSDALNEVEIMRMLQNAKPSGKNMHTNSKNFDDCKDYIQNETTHKWIVRFYDFWISYDRQLHQIYDYYEYGTLFDMIQYNERLNYLQILEIIKQICNALLLIHSLNIIHIDLKPSNIFITKDYILKLGDYGISINLNKINNLNNLDKNTLPFVSGDPIYISPELLTFNRKLTNDINCKTDIFSLGIILLELLCDIKAPSQGKIFHNLRKNIIDFNIMEPSPIKKYKKNKNNKRKNKNRHKKKCGFNFSSNNKQNINLDNENIDFKIVENIDTEIKDLCTKMLQQNSNLRPNCKEILNKIHEILNNESYQKHFHPCKSLDALSLPPKTIINNVNSNNNNIGGASHCNSHCNSNKKIENNGANEIHWFYQESPKCYKALFHFTPHTNMNKSNDEFQLNLNSAFDNAKNQNSPFLFNNNSNNYSSNSNSKDSKYKFNLIKEEDSEINDDDIYIDCDDFRPQNLLFSFN